MYPNLYFALKDWFGWEINAFKIFYTFGIFVAIAFIISAWVLTLELKRKEKLGLLTPRLETITTGEAVTLLELVINGFIGFLFGYKLIGAFIASRQEGVDLQEYIFSSEGSWMGGLIIGAVMAFLKYRERNKQKLAKPEKRSIRIWPHDRVGDIVIFALVFGILGAKLFDNLENWDRFISLLPLIDSAAPALMIAYAIGRMGCQVSGDGDWGIYNSAYISDIPGKAVLASPGQFEEKLNEHSTYFLKGSVTDSSGRNTYVTDRIAESLDKVPHRSFRAPSFLPVWMVAYTYPHNVNEDGILLENCEGRYCRVLPQPVYPTPFYEIIACGLLFGILWAIRRKVKAPGVMFSIYLVMNGVERFLVELIRVNSTYSIFGFHPTQAELISAIFVLLGIGGIYLVKYTPGA